MGGNGGKPIGGPGIAPGGRFAGIGAGIAKPRGSAGITANPGGGGGAGRPTGSTKGPIGRGGTPGGILIDICGRGGSVCSDGGGPSREKAMRIWGKENKLLAFGQWRHVPWWRGAKGHRDVII